MARTSTKAPAAAPGKAKPSKDLAPRTGNTSLANIDSQLNSEIDSIKSQIGGASGNKIRVEPTGDFILPDGMNLGNEIKIVVVDFASKNTLYLTPFNKDNPTPPDCYAIGKNIAAMAPEDDSPDKQSDNCAGCPMNAFGSGQNGRSKACKNARVLAVLLVDDNDPEAHNAPDAPLYTIEVSPTSIKSFDGCVSNIARSLNGPPIKAVITVVGKNAGTYATLSFIEPEANPDYATHFERRQETDDVLYRKPDFAAYEAKAKAPARRAPARRSTPSRR